MALDRLSLPLAGKVIAFILLCVGLIALFRLAPPFRAGKIAVDDFVEYWAAGRLSLHGAYTYSPKELLVLEQRAGWRYGDPTPMWNPPWTLPLVMPFGIFDYPVSRLLWFAANTAIIIFCACLIYRFYGGPPARRWLAPLIAFTFLPTLIMLIVGQSSAVVLLGAVLLLLWAERGVWWLAPLAMLLITFKPHILYLVPLAFFLWTVGNNRWSLLFLSATGIGAAAGLAAIFNPHIIQQYFYGISHNHIAQFPTPTIGRALVYFVGFSHVWVQFVPMALSVIWLCLHWWKNRIDWNWRGEIPLIAAVSVLASPYAWPLDYVVLLLAVLPMAASLLQRPMDRVLLLALVIYLAIEAATLWCLGHGHGFFSLIWLAPSLAGWCLLVARLTHFDRGLAQLPAL